MNQRKKKAIAPPENARDTHIVENLRTILRFAGVGQDEVVRTMNLIDFMRGLPS